MPFIRQNLFLIVLAGITVVLVAGLLVVNAGVAGDIDQQIKTREDVAAKLSQLKKAGPNEIVNEATIEKLRVHVDDIKKLSAQITKQIEDWNRRNFSAYKYTVGDEKDKPILSFPLKEADPNTLAAPRQAQGMAKQYVKEVDDLIAKLTPTVPPDDATINDAIDAAFENLKLEEVPVADSATEKIKPHDGTRTPSDGTPAPPPVDIKTRATRDGTVQAIIKNSDNGLVYVIKDTAIHQVLDPMGLSASHSDLWEAQLQLWILGDIVAAIDQTNQQALSGEGGAEVKPVLVSNAAIKQLVRLQIDPRYALGEATVASGSAFGGPAAGSMTPPTPPAGAGAGDSGIKGDQCLSRRVTSKEYDVKRYTLTLVMATRYLRDFERYLMQRNYHTILNVSIKTPADLGGDINKFYFGPEPVMMVTISGELLLLSGWERPLMPKDVLEDWVPKNLR